MTETGMSKAGAIKTVYNVCEKCLWVSLPRWGLVLWRRSSNVLDWRCEDRVKMCESQGLVQA